MSRYVLALALAVFACAWVALFYRPTNTYLNHLVLDWLGHDFLHMRNWVSSSVPLHPTLVYNAPGAWWVFGLSLLGWRLRIGRFHLFYLGLIIAVGFEITQITGLTDGTFDWLDLVWILPAFGAAYWFCHRALPSTWRANPGRWRYVLYALVLFAAFGADVL